MGFLNDLSSNAASAVRFRYMVPLGQDTGLQASSPADIFPLRTPPGAAQIPSCDSNGAATQFEGNEAIRWDLIWHLFDLTGDGRDDLIAQVPDFAVCAQCFRWQVYPAQLAGGSFWTFATNGIDLNLPVTQDLDSSLGGLDGRWLTRILDDFTLPFAPNQREILRTTTSAWLHHNAQHFQMTGLPNVSPIAPPLFGLIR